MRVFYAVTFDSDIKNRLFKYRKLIEKNSIKGKFTDIDNFHLTLEFIGEVNKNKLDELISILYELKSRPEKIITSHVGSFKRKNKEIIWIGIETNKRLLELQRELKKLLIQNRYEIDNRKYRPHITMGRQIVRACTMDDIIIEPIEIPIRSIALMESKRENDKLVYKPIKEIMIY